MTRAARRGSAKDPRACRVLSRRPIRHALLHTAARKFYRLITLDELWPSFVEAFPELARLIEHEKRATRRDLRQGIGSVMWAVFSRTDLKSFRVGWRRRYRSRDGRVFDFCGLPRKVLAKWTTLAESTVSRACTLLRRGDVMAGPGRDGYNHIPQPVETCDVSPATPHGRKGLPAVRRIFEDVFARLGLGPWLNKLRNPEPPPAAEPSAPAGPVASRNVVRVADVVGALARALGPPAEAG